MQLKQTNTLRSVFEQGYAETRHFGAQGLTLDYLFLAILKQRRACFVSAPEIAEGVGNLSDKDPDRKRP